MIVVVADTSPIHYLIQIRVVEVLPKLFDQVLIPVTVERELLDPSAPLEVRLWLRNRPNLIAVQSARDFDSLATLCALCSLIV